MKILCWTLALVLLPLAVQDSETRPAKPPAPVVGKAAPSFRLNDQAGVIVGIGGAQETWTVLAFFPKAMTPG